MPDLMNYLRMANIFSPMIGNDLPEQGGITGNMPRPDLFGNIRFGNPMMTDPTTMGNTQVASPDDYDAGARMRELYTPEHVASDRYNEMIGGYPKYEDYKPSLLRRIGAALIATGQSFGPRGFAPNQGAIENGMEFMNRPYNTKFTDWKNQIGPAQQAATLERSNNQNERTLAYQTVSQEIAQRRADATARNQEAKNKIAADRAEVYRLKSLKKNYKFDFSGPNVIVTDGDTGQVIPTNIATGSLSDSDKLELQHENRMGEIQEGGRQQRQTEEVRQTGRESLAETRGWKPYEETLPDGTKRTFMYNEITGETRDKGPGGTPNARPVSRTGTGTGNKPESPTQTRVRQFNAARELYNTRPDLRPFIKLGTPGNNDFSVTPPSESRFFGHSGPTTDQLAEINTAIYGNPQGADIQMAPAHTTTPNRTPAQAPAGNTIKQYSPSRNQTRISTDGGKTWKIVPGRQ